MSDNTKDQVTVNREDLKAVCRVILRSAVLGERDGHRFCLYCGNTVNVSGCEHKDSCTTYTALRLLAEIEKGGA